MIFMDVHEKDPMPELIQDTCQNVSIEALGAGDYLVDHYLIERKRWGELAGRLKTNENDIFTQILGLKTACEEESLDPVLLMEGDRDRGLARTAMSDKYIDSALTGIFKMGVAIYPTAGRDYTARFMASLEKNSTSAKPRAIRDSPRIPKTEWDRYIVEGFQGIGPSTATSILDEFETVQAVMNAEIDELKAVDGVGTKTAEKIYLTARGRMSEL